MMRLLVLITAMAIALAACKTTGVGADPMGEFFAGSDSTDAVGPFDQGFARAVNDPRNTVVVIYNHGTDWGGKFQDCLPDTMPRFIQTWGSNGIAGHDVAVFYLCSQVVEKRYTMGRQRAEENEALLDRLATLGVPPEHIFIFGHSGGASTALMTAERASQKFNAAIVSAPGYGFAWLDAQGESYPWMDVEYDKWRGRLAGAENMNALVYVFDGDIYAPPKDALFLRDHPGVEVVEIHASDDSGILCKDEPDPHFYWWSACFRNEQKDIVEHYIEERLGMTGQASL